MPPSIIAGENPTPANQEATGGQAPAAAGQTGGQPRSLEFNDDQTSAFKSFFGVEPKDILEFQDEKGNWHGKYKNLGEALKGGKNAMDKIFQGEGKAPEKYEFDYGDLKEDFEKFIGNEDPVYKAVLDGFKQANVPQAVADKVIKSYLTSMKENGAFAKMAEAKGQSDDDFKNQELTKLGQQKDEIIGKLVGYANGLSEEEKSAFENLVTTAVEAKVVYDLITKANNSNMGMPGNNASKGAQKDPDYNMPKGLEAGLAAKKFYDENHKTISQNLEQQKYYDKLMYRSALVD